MTEARETGTVAVFELAAQAIFAVAPAFLSVSLCILSSRPAPSVLVSISVSVPVSVHSIVFIYAPICCLLSACCSLDRPLTAGGATRISG